MKKVFFTVCCLSVVCLKATGFDWAPAQQTFEMSYAIDICQPKSFVLTANENRFYELPLSHQDAENIHRLVKTLATKEWYKLLKQKKDMEKLGDKIKASVHPLRFIACILQHQERKQYLYDIKDYTLLGVHIKWKYFKDGLFDRLEYMQNHNKLGPYIPGFAKELGVNADLLIDYANRKKWNEFIQYIMP